MSETIELTYPDGTPATTINVATVNEGVTALRTLRVSRSGTPNQDVFFAILGGGRTISPTTLADGSEAIAGRWIQARIGGGSWTPLGGLEATLAIPTDSTTDIDLQIVVPVGARTVGSLRLSLELFFGIRS